MSGEPNPHPNPPQTESLDRTQSRTPPVPKLVTTTTRSNPKPNPILARVDVNITPVIYGAPTAELNMNSKSVNNDLDLISNQAHFQGQTSPPKS